MKFFRANLGKIDDLTQPTHSAGHLLAGGQHNKGRGGATSLRDPGGY